MPYIRRSVDSEFDKIMESLFRQPKYKFGTGFFIKFKRSITLLNIYNVNKTMDNTIRKII